MQTKVMVDDHTALTFTTFHLEADMYIIVCRETGESTLFIGDEAYEL